MVMLLAAALMALVVAGCSPAQQAAEAAAAQEAGGAVEMPDVLNSIKWFGHASFMFADGGNSVFYVDPHEFSRLPSYEKADIILITHAHYDHCDPDAVKRILKPDTVIAVPAGCREKLGVNAEFVDVVPGSSYEIKGFRFRTIPAYNTNPERLQYHPEGNGWVGYIFQVNNHTVYHAGDTDFIDKMKNLGKISIALLPMGGTYTMGVDEAIQAANAIAADITVPMHYRRLLNKSYPDAEEKFKAGVKGRVMILDEVA